MMKLLQTLLFTTTLAVLLAGSPAFVVPNAEAQEGTPPTSEANTNPQPQPNDQQLDESGARVNTAEKLQFGTIAGWVYDALKTIGGLFAYLGGSLLDISLSLFVMDMPGTAESWGIKTVIDEIWKMVRDIFNLLFIFGIIFVGFKLILGTDETGAKRTLGTIIIAALLINFSLYATKVVVDFGNIVAAEMATLLKTESPENSNGTNTENEVGGLKVTNISDSFVAKINPEQIVNNSFALERSAIEKSEGTIAFQGVKKTELDLMDALIMGLTTAFTLTLVGFVFAAGAFLMFTRFLYLVFLMMFSPIMFLGFVLPNFKKRSSDWWHKLFTQTLIGPAYLFMLYIALKSLENMESIQSDSTLISYVMLCIVVCGFAWAALLVANSMGSLGATQAISLGRSWGRSARGYAGRAAGGASFGLAARLGRAQIGERAHRFAESDTAKKAARQKGLRGTFNRARLGVAKVAADSSFDARKVGGIGNKLGIGEGRKGGYKTETEEIFKREKAYADSLGTISDDDPQVMRLKTELEVSDSAVTDKKKEISELRKSGASNTEIEKHKAELEDLEKKKQQHAENLSAEKHRIQLGTKRNVPEAINDSLKEEKENEKKFLTEFAGLQERKSLAEKNKDENEKILVEARMVSAQKNIAQAKKKIADLQKKAAQTSGGYVAELENVGVIKNFFLGRYRAQNKEVAEKLRGEYEKNIKGKGKEDKGKPADEKKGDK